jgi:hypothetical protein
MERPTSDVSVEGTVLSYGADFYYYNEGYGSFLKIKNDFKNYCLNEIKKMVES